MTVRTDIELRGVRLSYLDFGGPGTPVLALHGHFGRARMWDRHATELPGHRVHALEQRVHGHSAQGVDVHPDSYVADAAAFIRKLGLGPLPVIGHSMGGVVAFRLAARHPDLVTAFVAIDAGCRDHSTLDISTWPRRVASQVDLRRAIEERGIPSADYFLESAVEYPSGWGLLFDHDDLMASQRALMADWTADWFAATCPALLVHGGASPMLSTALAREMAERPRTRLEIFPGRGHWVHDEDPAGVGAVIRDFLSASCA